MKRLMLTLMLLWLIPVLLAQPILAPIGRNIGVGSYSRHFQHLLSAWYTPAGLSCLSAAALGVYAERRFMLQEMPLYGVVGTVPVPGGAFGAGIFRFGNTAWHQQQVGGAYGRQLGAKAGVGLKFSYTSVTVQGAGNSGSFSVQGGLLWHFSEKLHMGVNFLKPLQEGTVYSLGVGWEASGQCLLTGELMRMPAFTQVKAAAFYRLGQALALEMGVTSAPVYNNAGIVFYLHSLRIDVAAAFHPQLGLTPSTVLIWQLPTSAK